MIKRIEGRVHRLGHHVRVDQIYPARYEHVREPDQMRRHLFEDLDPGLSGKTGSGDIIVAGRIFGLGPRSEAAAAALVESGIACVIAESFERHFYREAVNQGLVVLEQPEARERIKDGEMIEIDLDGGEIRCKKGPLKFPPCPLPIARILQAGGLLAYVRDLIGRK
jgi:3-isopropylmalate/(R)-2-methylmalate dehydratase small subunit